MAKEMSKSELRKKFGHCGGPLKATRVLRMEMEHFTDKGIDGQSLIVIDDTAGTFVAANMYDGNLGKNYDPEGMTHALPAPDSDKWKSWRKKGYEEVVDLAAYAAKYGVVTIVTIVTVEATEPEPAKS